MSEPENFLSRWSRRKREAEATPEDEAVGPESALPAADAAAPPGEAAAPARPSGEADFDLASLPSLESIAADTDVSMFMKPEVPSALRHAALRRAWASDPAIRDFRGPQENDWDFTAPDGVPGFGTFKSEDEIKALARRLFGPDRREEPRPVPQPIPEDSVAAERTDVAAEPAAAGDDPEPAPTSAPAEEAPTTAVQQNEHVAEQRDTARRHGGALPR